MARRKGEFVIVALVGIVMSYKVHHTKVCKVWLLTCFTTVERREVGVGEERGCREEKQGRSNF